MFAPAQLGAFNNANANARTALQNHFVLSPMTRCRAGADDAVPSPLAAEYYAQRASAGLLITEGTAPSPSGRGYARIPGLWSEAQVDGWRAVTERVHQKGAVMFAQLMHTGRVSHPLNFPTGGEHVAPSAVRLEEGQMATDQAGAQDYPTPRALTEAEITQTIADHVKAARNAVAAGFDGVELHGANGYLSEQFFNPLTNQRPDGYGGDIVGRTRFTREVLAEMAAAIGKERVGIRLSPYGAGGGMKPYPDAPATYEFLADECARLGIAYMHIVDHSKMGAPPVPSTIKQAIRTRFGGTYIAAGGFDLATAEAALAANEADLIAFGRPFIANPDLVARLAHGWPLATPDRAKFYSPGAAGYSDYPAHTG